MAELVPMLRQYFDLKEQCPGCILLYRIGDFYEMFYEDAKLVSGELDLVLTKHASGLDDPAPMCGIPYHSAARGIYTSSILYLVWVLRFLSPPITLPSRIL